MRPYLARLLDALRPEIGWSETGGRIIRDPRTGDVVGRTRWIARSDFWQDRPVRISEREAHAALNGGKLTSKQREFLKYAREVAFSRQWESIAEDREAILERRAIMREGFGL